MRSLSDNPLSYALLYAAGSIIGSITLICLFHFDVINLKATDLDAAQWSMAAFAIVIYSTFINRVEEATYLIILVCLIFSGACAIFIFSEVYLSHYSRIDEIELNVYREPVFNICKSHSECRYFSLVTFSTLGYGDFQPHPNVRLTAGMHALLGYVFLGFLIVSLQNLLTQGVTDNPKRKWGTFEMVADTAWTPVFLVSKFVVMTLNLLEQLANRFKSEEHSPTKKGNKPD